MSSAAAAQTAVDADTIKLNGSIYRIHGVDAPEARQICADGWPAGAVATAYMAELMRDKAVVCEAKTQDRYGRTVALCRADGRDLGAELVSAGMAWAFTRYSNDYIGQEARAKAEGLGIHGHDCLAAWDWRGQQRR